jgi:phosphoglycolate phosphatase-like HAD superfamily hydrolase
MSVKVIVFDFDGTLADTLDAIVSITNRLAKTYGYKPTEPEELAQIRNMSSREIVKQSNISIFKLPFLLRRIKADLKNDIQQIKPILGIKEALTQLKNEGNLLGILTSNSEENVRAFLQKHNMEDLFSFIYSETTLFGKHKVLNKFIKQNNLIPEEVIYVGDETRDIESSKKINVKVIAVSWGFNSREALAKQNPEFLIDKPSELVDLMGSLKQIVS